MLHKISVKKNYPVDVIVSEEQGVVIATVLNTIGYKKHALETSTGSVDSILVKDVISTTGNLWVNYKDGLVSVNGKTGYSQERGVLS